MKATVIEHIKQLDVESGGGIVSDKIRVNTIDNPMLVIGLGGTGIDALLRLKYQVNRKFKLPFDPITKRKRETPKKIEFLAFETNEYDRNKTYNGIGLDPVKEFVLLSNPEIGGILQNRSILEPYITDWLSPDLLISDGINGASGVRQAGRLLLFTKINKVVETIGHKIETLLEGTGKRLYVFILTGLSGGTGSGCFLDISYITRGIIERKFGAGGVDKVSMLGYLFTPDVNLSKKGLSSHTVEYIEKNGYAALKELDYWMNCEERGERFQVKYGNLLNVNSPMPPFNLCHLISATNTEGKRLENAYDYAMNVTAENITNFMANEDTKGDEFAIHDYISNIRTNIAQMPKMYSANYQYNIIGASLAEIPLEQMTTYVAYKLFEKINSIFEANPGISDIDQFAAKLRIDPDSLHIRFNERVPEPLSGFENSDRFSYNNVIKNAVIDLDEELRTEYLVKAKEQYRHSKRNLPGEIIEDFRKQVDKLFLHPQKGPIFASRLIFSNEGACLLKTIQTYIEALEDKLERLPQSIRSEEGYAFTKFDEAKRALISKDKKKNAYIEAKVNEYHARAEKERIDDIIELYEELIQLFNSENSRIYEVYKEILETLNVIFKKNADILVNNQEVKHDNQNRTYYWQLVSVPDVTREVERMFDSKDGEMLVQQWSEMLLERSSQWIKESEIDVVGSISTFLSNQFGDLITKSMEDFLRIKYGEDQPIDQTIERTIAKRLDDDALPVFHLANSMGNLHLPTYGFVSVPVKAPKILEGIKNFQKHAVSHSNFTVKESEMKNRIFWLNTKNGVPLYAYSPLHIFEESYEKSVLEKEGIGRHLVQTEKENWAFLPSPIPEKSWGDTYTNKRLKQYNQSIRDLFDEAFRFGCIVEQADEQNTGAKYLCKFTAPISIEEIFKAHNVDHQQIEKALPGNLKQCLKQLKDLSSGKLELAGEPKYIFDSTTLERAKDNFIRTPKLVEQIREEVKKFSIIEEKINELEQYINAQKDLEASINHFIEALYTKTIRKRGALLVFDKEPEEDPWEPFVNLTKTSQFVDYELFQAFNRLSEKQMALLLKKSEKRSSELLGQEDSSELVKALEEMAATYQHEKEALDYDRDEFVNGEELYAFYKDVMIKVNNILKQIK